MPVYVHLTSYRTASTGGCPRRRGGRRFRITHYRSFEKSHATLSTEKCRGGDGAQDAASEHRSLEQPEHTTLRPTVVNYFKMGGGRHLVSHGSAMRRSAFADFAEPARLR